MNRNGDTLINPLPSVEFDWEYFLQLSAEHRLTPLVFRCLSAEDSVPSSTLADLESRTRWITYQNLNMVRTLQRVFELFEAHDIRALPYKGPSLAVAVHDDITFRGSADLDVLLRKEDVLRTMDLLLANGFQPKNQLTAREKRVSLRSSRHLSVISEDDIKIELHWRVTRGHFPFDVDFDQMWASRGSIDIAGGTLPMISPDFLVVLLAVHGNHHCWTQLAWLCDFAGMVSAFDYDWLEVLRVASRHGGERMLLVSIQLVHDLVGVEIPPVVQRRIGSDPLVATLTEQVKHEFLWKTEFQPLAKTRYQFRIRERFMDKFRIIALLAVLPTTRDYEPLPASIQFYPLAVLCRLIRLASSTGTSLVDLFRKTKR